MKNYFQNITRYLMIFSLLILSAISVHTNAAENHWVNKNGNTYYYQNNVALTGLQNIGDYYYFFNDFGELQKGVVNIKGSYYYFNTNTGVLNFGWQRIGGKDYYFSNKGTMGTHVNKKKISGNYKKGSVYGPKLSKKELTKVQGKVKYFVNHCISNNMSDYEKVLAAHDYLCAKVSYSNSSNYNKTKSNTAYGALVKRKAQCSGYARAFKALCDAMGVPCKYIKASNCSHQWNLVKVDKKWYHIDVQCNDSSGFDAIFLTKDATMRSMGVKWSKKLPACKSDYQLKAYFPD